MTDMEPTMPTIGQIKTWTEDGELVTAVIHGLEFVNKTCEVELITNGRSKWTRVSWEEWSNA